MSKTPELLGATKLVRAIRNVVYKGVEYRGRQRERIDEKDGSYHFDETHPGDEFECDALFAKQAENAGEVVLLSGGRVSVTEQKDGYHTYTSWQHNLSDPAPVFERCELLKPMFFGDGCHLPVGTKCRLDVSLCDRRKICYSDETQQAEHTLRVMAPSPKRVKLNAIEQAGKVNAIFEKLFPAAV